MGKSRRFSVVMELLTTQPEICAFLSQEVSHANNLLTKPSAMDQLCGLSCITQDIVA